MKKRLLVGVLISLTLLWLAVRKVNPEEFREAILNLDMKYLVPSFLLTIAVCVLRSLRWKLLFSKIKEIRTENLFSVIMIGYLANSLLPARLGDVVMACLIGKKEDISKSMAFGTIFIDRVLDVATLIVVLAVTVILNPFPEWVKRIAVTGAVLLLCIGITVWFFAGNNESGMRIIQVFLKPLPLLHREKVAKIMGNFIDGLSTVRSFSILIRAFIISMAVWSGLALGVYLLFLSFGFSLNFGAALAVLAIVNLGLVIPSAPGFVGTFQFLCIAALGLFQINNSHALGFSIVYHLSQFLPTILVGFYYLNKENLTLGRLALARDD